MNSFKNAAIIVLLAVIYVITGCSNNSSQNHIPRREAYPRPQLYDTTYRTITGIPLHLEINKASDIKIEHKGNGSVWLTQRYPAYGISVYYTILRIDSSDIEMSMKRSLQRMTDNLGPIAGKRYEASGRYGFNHYVLLSDEIAPFPMQFVSTDWKQWLVTGSATYSEGILPTSYDSIAPILSALRKDMTHTLNTIGHDND